MISSSIHFLASSNSQQGYDIKLTNGEFDVPMNALMLRLKTPDISKALSDADYSNHLIEQSPPVQLVGMLLSPLKKLFNHKNYGPRYDNVVATPQESPDNLNGTAAMTEHGGISPPNSHDLAASANALSGSQSGVKEEEISTDDETNLFIKVEESFEL